MEPSDPTPRDTGYRAGARLRQADRHRTRGTVVVLAAIVVSGIAFAALDGDRGRPSASDRADASPSPEGTVARASIPEGTSLPAVAILGQPAPARPVPMNAGWVRWLDPRTGTLGGDADPPDSGVEPLTFVDAGGRAIQVCMSPPQDTSGDTYAVELCAFDAAGRRSDPTPIAMFQAPLPIATGLDAAPVQLDAAVSANGRRLWVTSAVRGGTSWNVELRVVDLATHAVTLVRRLREIPIHSAVVRQPSADGWLVEPADLIRPVIRVSPEGLRISLSLTAETAGPGLPQQERLVLDAVETTSSPIVAFHAGQASDTACDASRSGWANERIFFMLCSHGEADGALQPFVRIENPDDMTRDVSVGLEIAADGRRLVRPFDNSSWLLDARDGMLYRWDPSGLNLSTLDVKTRAGSTISLDPAGGTPKGGIETPLGGTMPDGEVAWGQLVSAGSPAAGMQIVGSGDGRYLYLVASPPVGGFAGRRAGAQSSLLWVVATDTLVMLGRGEAPALVDQVGLAPGGGPLIAMLTPEAPARGLPASDWVVPVWFVDQATGQPLAVAGRVRGPGGVAPSFLNPTVGTLAGF
ncbi:MAG: hypothetical protein HY264_04275 [Chloroflexi bacterium]|nr:hypothetical protein [Chloroflexota bacterium]